MNIKNDDPKLYSMMGEFYRLLESLYEEWDWVKVCELSDAFVQKWAAQVSGLDKELAVELVQGILRAKDSYQKEGSKNGR